MMVLLLLVIAGGKEEPILSPPITMPPTWLFWPLVKMLLPLEEEPQLFSIKIVPSPSVIVRWSQTQLLPQGSMSNAVNCKEMISPCSTWIVSVTSRLFG